ncbi:MAG TPA: aldo/keto reductase [Chloroflexota bacterium]|nr:aldo/keto reductase [Chloroflexota bacterium]
MEVSATLPLRRLGSTELTVPPLCIGCATLGDMPETFGYSVAEETALQTLRAVFAGPVHFVDTAASYGDGESERRIGVVLRERGGLPPGFVLSTKADRNLQTGDFSGDQVRRSIERSLRLLGLDRLQLVYLHDPEHTTFEAAMAPGGPVDVLRRAHGEGVIDHIGVAGGPIALMERYVETGLFDAAISHNRYTLLNRLADRFWDVCRRNGVAALNAAPYGSGILAKGPDAYPRYAYQDAGDDVIRRAQALEDVCRRFDVPLRAVALHFSLRDPRITSTIVGISKPERLQETLRLAALPIPAEVWDALATVPYSTDEPEG